MKGFKNLLGQDGRLIGISFRFITEKNCHKLPILQIFTYKYIRLHQLRFSYEIFSLKNLVKKLKGISIFYLEVQFTITKFVEMIP